MDTFMSSSHRNNELFPKLLLAACGVTQGAASEVFMALPKKMAPPEPWVCIGLPRRMLVV